jgi:hypothetical protein
VKKLLIISCFAAILNGCREDGSTTIPNTVVGKYTPLERAINNMMDSTLKVRNGVYTVAYDNIEVLVK